jgi:hypothetical protein
VVAILAIAPGPVSADGRPAAEMPGVSVLLRVLGRDEPAKAPARRQAAAAKPVAAPAAKPATGVVDVPDAIAPAADLVRVTTVLYARQNPSAEGFDLGGPCPRASTCGVHQLNRVRWKADETGRVVIPFAYNDDGRRELRAPDEATVLDALGRAMGEWSRWNSNIAFTNTGTSDATFGADGPDGSCADGTNVVTWERFSNDVVGAAATCLDRAGRVVRDTDLALNINHRWQDGTNERRPGYDLQSIFTHELGHWLGLADLYVGIDASRQTMFGSTNHNEVHARTLALGDIRGVQRAYPCAAGDACSRAGISDD